MDVQTITMPKAEALERFRQYRSSVRERATAEDMALAKGYRALSQGKAILDLAEVVKTAGLDHQWQPKLAVARADAPAVWFWGESDGRGTFSIRRRWETADHATRCYLRMPAQTFPVFPDDRRHSEMRALVPPVPLPLRPQHALSHYHLLWEAQWTAEPPRDPILCRRLAGMLFVVVAQWDLTDLERAVLRGRA
jgi:hypothetical protein